MKQDFGFGCPAIIPLNTIEYRTSSEMRGDFDLKQPPQVTYRSSIEIFDISQRMKAMEAEENIEKGTLRVETQSLV
jgi:hypothetical protein